MLHNVEGVEFRNLETVFEAYKENGVTLCGLQKAHQRGKEGDNLIPEKKRKNYVPPVPEDTNKFIVGERKFRSQAAACREFNVKECTYRKRIEAGWTREEALGITPKKRGKQYFINGENLTAQEMSEKFNRKVLTIRDLLKRGATPEQAAGIMPIKRGELISQVEWQKNHTKKRGKDKNTNVFTQITDKKTLISQKAVKKTISDSQKPLPINSKHETSSKGKSLQNTIKVEETRKTVRGRRNEAFFRNRPELGNLPGFIYFAKLEQTNKKPAKGKEFYKIGITANFEKRKPALKFVSDFWIQETTQLYASIAEEQIKNFFADKKTDKFSAKDFDGKDEVFELTESEAQQAQQLIKLSLFYLENSINENETGGKEAIWLVIKRIEGAVLHP